MVTYFVVWWKDTCWEFILFFLGCRRMRVEAPGDSYCKPNRELWGVYTAKTVD